MPNSTAELGLKTALDTDDAADYETIYLSQSLTTIDGLFNQTSGHTHNGAHQGGPIGSGAFAAALDIPDWFRSTGHRSAFATAGAGIEMYYDGTNGVLVGYDRGGTAYRPIVVGGSSVTLQVSGQGIIVITANGMQLHHADGSAASWIRARAGTAGVEFVNNAYTAVTFGVDDSGNVTIPGALNVGGNSQITGNVVAAQLQALNGNLYLGSAHLYDLGSGAMATGGGLSVTGAVNASGNATVQNNAANIVPYTVQGAVEHIEHGQFTINGVNNNTGANQSITFARAFAGNPIVIISVGAVSGGDVQQWHAAAQNITTANFNARVFNTTGGTGNCQIYWLAMGN